MRRARLERGWDQYELADLAGCSQGLVSFIETWARRPGPDVRVALARALGVRVRDLFEVDEIDEGAS